MLFLHHILAQSHNKVICETFDNHTVGAGYVHCTPENNILALGTHGRPWGPGHIGICTPGNQQLCCCQIARQGGGGSLKRCALAGQPIQYEHHVSWLGLQKKPIQTFLQVVLLLGTTVAPPRDIKSLPALNLFQMMVRHDLLET